MMRRRWPAVAVAVAACVLTGCADGTPDTPAVTSAPAPAATSATPVVSATGAAPAGTSAGPAAGPDRFVAVVRAQLPEIAVDRRDEEIQAIADTACTALVAGRSADDIVAAARTLGTADAEATDHVTARELVKLAIDTTCFGERDRVDEF